MEVKVYDNQIERALKVLKKKLSKDGVFSQMKERRFYDKPSVRRRKKRAKALRRERKLLRRAG